MIACWGEEIGAHTFMKSSFFRSTLWEGNEFLELAEASAGIGIWDVDLATGIVRGRPQFFKLMGRTRQPSRRRST